MSKGRLSKHQTRGPGADGRIFRFENNIIQSLKTFYDKKREQNESVVNLHLRNEACKLDPSCLDVEENTLRMRIYWLFKIWNVSYCQATHKAQNTILSGYC
jgi:hypothetical protein